MKIAICLAYLVLLISEPLLSQEGYFLDQTYIQKVEGEQPDKVLHAEPLFIDLIRDLGARKGEAEWNFAFGIRDFRSFVEYHALIEYEWAPIDRLGLEIELPFYFSHSYFSYTEDSLEDIPAHRLDSLKLASQYTWFVSTAWATSMAFGYIQEFLLPSFTSRHKKLQGYVYNPFFIAAKRWGLNFHTLVYTGPFIEKPKNAKAHFEYHLNTSLHWMIPGTRNFLGLETNLIYYENKINITFRPQMRLSIADNFLIGIVSVLPTNLISEGMGFFVRVIYEPGHDH